MMSVIFTVIDRHDVRFRRVQRSCTVWARYFTGRHDQSPAMNGAARANPTVKGTHS